MPLEVPDQVLEERVKGGPHEWLEGLSEAQGSPGTLYSIEVQRALV